MPRYESPYDPASMPRNLEHVRYEKKGHVAYVTLNRPEVRNALRSYPTRSCVRAGATSASTRPSTSGS